jgi:hypothetical protein
MKRGMRDIQREKEDIIWYEMASRIWRVCKIVCESEKRDQEEVVAEIVVMVAAAVVVISVNIIPADFGSNGQMLMHLNCCC